MPLQKLLKIMFLGLVGTVPDFTGVAGDKVQGSASDFTLAGFRLESLCSVVVDNAASGKGLAFGLVERIVSAASVALDLFCKEVMKVRLGPPMGG